MAGDASDDHRTRPGFAAPTAGEPDGASPPVPPPPPFDPHEHTPLVDVEVLYQRGPAPSIGGPLHALEVWTLNTVYVMDPALVCVEVRDRASGRVDPESRFLGKRLVGGQHRSGDAIELSYPFPRPGTEAVFEIGTARAAAFARTSTVVHVKLRMHVVTVSPHVVAPTWAEIRTSLVPPPDAPET